MIAKLEWHVFGQKKVEKMSKNSIRHPCLNMTVYFRGNDWRVHLKCHMNIRDHVCPFCSARFSTKGGLGEHIKRHQGEKNYTCSYCDAKFVNKSGLTRHMGTHDHVGR